MAMLKPAEGVPYELLLWDSPKIPDEAGIRRLLALDGFEPEEYILESGTKTAERKAVTALLQAVVSGVLQVSCPGYTVVELNPGDMLRLNQGIVYDLTVLSKEPVVYLQASL